MISAAHPYSGLSAVDILKLFSAVPASSSSSAASTAQSATIGIFASSVSVSSVNDSANTIQAILVQAQIEKAPAATSEGTSTISATVEAAYATQDQDAARDQDASTTTSVEGWSSQSSKGSFTQLMFDQYQDPRRSYTLTQSITSVPSTSLADSANASASSSHSPGDYTDNFQMSVSLGGASIAVGFGLKGLDQVQTASNGLIVVGQGQYSAFLQFGLFAKDGSSGVSYDLNVFGLDAGQAQQLNAEFDQATSQLDEAGLASAGYSVDAMSGMIRQQTPASLMIGDG